MLIVWIWAFLYGFEVDAMEWHWGFFMGARDACMSHENIIHIAHMNSHSL
jgi:hypothetical protein